MRELRRIVTFGAVGGAASLVHLGLAGLLMARGLTIFPANVLGYAGGFAVSYLGHYHLTFGAARAHAQAMPRFLATALLGLGVNNAVLWFLVRLSGREAFGFIVLAIGVAAGVTYLIARNWAFGGRDSAP